MLANRRNKIPTRRDAVTAPDCVYYDVTIGRVTFVFLVTIDELTVVGRAGVSWERALDSVMCADCDAPN